MNSNRNRLDQLEQLVKIDETNLEAELISHPHDFYHVSTGAAEAVSVRDLAKFRVETYEADKYLEWRRRYIHNEEKFTEALLEKLVQNDEGRIKLVETYLEAKREADRWTALKDSFIQKGFMLKITVDNRRADNITESSYASQRREALNNFRRG